MLNSVSIVHCRELLQKVTNEIQTHGDFVYQAAGTFEGEEHSTGLMPKPDATGEDGLINTLTV